MCGIVATFDDKGNLIKTLLSGIKNLEYRGYDSSGSAFIDNKGHLSVYKYQGKIKNLENVLKNNKEIYNYGIIHTRWATHGIPNDINAHPHTDMNSNFSIVHNGIIENYSEIKSCLLKFKITFSTQTDTEVLVQLINYYYKQNPNNKFIEIVDSALKMVKGTYAIAVISPKYINEIVVARRGSPLAITKVGENYCAVSDPIALLNISQQYYFLEDGDIAVLNHNKLLLKRGKKIFNEIKLKKIASNPEEIGKAGYKHFMLKEIFEQPEIVSRLIADSDIKNLKLTKPTNIKIIACGTSYHAALIGKYYFEELCSINTDVEVASEFIYRKPVINKSTLYIFISQSGETADTLTALKLVSKFSKNTLSITNVVGSTISRESKSVIYTRAGIEIGVASTKTFIAQLMVLLLLSIRWSNNRFIMKKDLFSIPIKIDEILNQLNSIKIIAFKLKDYKSLLVMGRYLSFPIALECALKIKELSYIHAEGYASGEMKHGPIALLDDNYPVIFFCPNDSIAIKSLSNSQEILARKGKLFFITSEDFKNNTVNPVFKLPKTSNYVYPILSAVFLQLLSYEIALQKKLNVDQPRNLAKSVTVE